MKRAPSAPTPLGVRLGATFFLIGEAAPFAPATWTSLAVVPLLYPFMAWPLWIQITLLAVVTGYAVVVSDRADFDWAVASIRKHRLDAAGVALLFSPVHGALAARELAEWVLASGLNVRLHLQLHKLVWPDRDRGV